VTPLARSLGWQGLCAAIALGLLLSLGFWQLQRREWKEALIARVETNMRSAPVELPNRDQWAVLTSEDYDYRHVRVRGQFDFAKVALVFAQAPPGAGQEPGYLVLTPLRLEGGGEALVNRGFVAQSRVGRGAWRSEPAGQLEFSALMRAPQARNLFTPADDPAKGQWYTADPAKIAAALGVAEAAPFLLQQDPGTPYSLSQPEGLLRALLDAPEIPNNHLSYALTWFALAGALAVIFSIYARDRLKPP